VPTEGSPDSGVQGTVPTGESPGPGGPGGPGDTYRGIPGSRDPGTAPTGESPGPGFQGTAPTGESRGRRPAGGMGWDSRGRVAERRPLVAANTRTQHTHRYHIEWSPGVRRWVFGYLNKHNVHVGTTRLTAI